MCTYINQKEVGGEATAEHRKEGGRVGMACQALHNLPEQPWHR